MSSTIETAQTLLAALDTGMSRHWREEDRKWREEDRQWRVEDMLYREEERKWFLLENEMREIERTWRKEDIEQRNVENARYLWMRFVEMNRRNVEEKSEQLRAISNLSALFAGFAVVTLTQFGFDTKDSPMWLITCYGVLTAISVCLHTIAMVLCTLILGSILKNGKLYVNEVAEEEFMIKCEIFLKTFRQGSSRPPAPRYTFENFWKMRCEGDWKCAFLLFTLGVFSFLVSLVPIGWIKFHYSILTACMFSGIVVISILIWVWKLLEWGSYLTSSSSSSRKRPVSPKEKDIIPSVISSLPYAWHIVPLQVMDDHRQHLHDVNGKAMHEDANDADGSLHDGVYGQMNDAKHDDVHADDVEGVTDERNCMEANHTPFDSDDGNHEGVDVDDDDDKEEEQDEEVRTRAVMSFKKKFKILDDAFIHN